MQMVTDAPVPPEAKSGPSITIVGLNGWARQYLRDAESGRRDDLHILRNSSSDLPLQEHTLPDGTVLVERAQLRLIIENSGTWIFPALYRKSGSLIRESIYASTQIQRIVEEAGAWPIEE